MASTAPVSAKEDKSTKVITKLVRFSFLTVFEPKAGMDGGPAKYSVQLLIPKKDKVTVDAINAMIKKAFDSAPAMLGKSMTSKAVQICNLRDGDEEHPGDPNYEGHWFLNAKSSTKPGVVRRDEDDKSIVHQLTPDDIKSGDYGYASINFFPYGPPKVKQSKGVACGLQNIMFIKEGEALGGRGNAAADFADSTDEFDADLD